jgi:hypothetical protein
MQFAGKLSEIDLRDVGKMTRTKMYWIRVVVANWYGTALLLAVVWGTIAGLLGKINPNWQAIGMIWALVAALGFWATYRTKRAWKRRLAELNAQLPVSFANDGVKLDGPNGATGFLPWRNFKSWREGTRVILVDQYEGNRAVILPVAQLTETEREPIRQFLKSHISSNSH